MPIAESSHYGIRLGSSQTGAEPIVEFQFADFSTEAVTQLGLNAGTWYFRTGCPAADAPAAALRRRDDDGRRSTRASLKDCGRAFRV